MHVIDNCILWNKNRAIQAKTRGERLRYEENIKNLEALKETDNEGQAQPVGEGLSSA